MRALRCPLRPRPSVHHAGQWDSRNGVPCDPHASTLQPQRATAGPVFLRPTPRGNRSGVVSGEKRRKPACCPPASSGARRGGVELLRRLRGLGCLWLRYAFGAPSVRSVQRSIWQSCGFCVITYITTERPNDRDLVTCTQYQILYCQAHRSDAVAPPVSWSLVSVPRTTLRPPPRSGGAGAGRT